MKQVQRRGLTLMEALIASTILAMMVVATAAALSSTAQHGQFAEDQIKGALASEAKLAEILAAEYDDMKGYNNEDQSSGNLLTASGSAFPDTYYRIGRSVSVKRKTHTFGGLGLSVSGLEIIITAYDPNDSEVFTITQFVPEPEE